MTKNGPFLLLKNNSKNRLNFWVSQNLASVFPIPVGLRHLAKTVLRTELASRCFYRRISPFWVGRGFACEFDFTSGIDSL